MYDLYHSKLIPETEASGSQSNHRGCGQFFQCRVSKRNLGVAISLKNRAISETKPKAESKKNESRGYYLKDNYYLTFLQSYMREGLQITPVLGAEFRPLIELTAAEITRMVMFHCCHIYNQHTHFALNPEVVMKDSWKWMPHMLPVGIDSEFIIGSKKFSIYEPLTDFIVIPEGSSNKDRVLGNGVEPTPNHLFQLATIVLIRCLIGDIDGSDNNVGFVADKQKIIPLDFGEAFGAIQMEMGLGCKPFNHASSQILCNCGAENINLCKGCFRPGDQTEFENKKIILSEEISRELPYSSLEQFKSYLDNYPKVDGEAISQDKLLKKVIFTAYQNPNKDFREAINLARTIFFYVVNELSNRGAFQSLVDTLWSSTNTRGSGKKGIRSKLLIKIRESLLENISICQQASDLIKKRKSKLKKTDSGELPEPNTAFLFQQANEFYHSKISNLLTEDGDKKFNRLLIRYKKQMFLQAAIEQMPSLLSYMFEQLKVPSIKKLTVNSLLTQVLQKKDLSKKQEVFLHRWIGRTIKQDLSISTKDLMPYCPLMADRATTNSAAGKASPLSLAKRLGRSLS